MLWPLLLAPPGPRLLPTAACVGFLLLSFFEPLDGIASVQTLPWLLTSLNQLLNLVALVGSCCAALDAQSGFDLLLLQLGQTIWPDWDL